MRSRRGRRAPRAGTGYDDAVAEGLVERIGAEIDKRVDARLAQRGEAPRRRASPAAR
jgi:hypothetical protein